MEVDWHRRAQDQLADIWVAATPAERDEIERTVLDINAQLAAAPASLGESRGPQERFWFHRPLAVRFHVFVGGLVRVTQVRWVRPKRNRGGP